MHPAKTQINLSIRAVWSESSLSSQWVAKSFRWTDSEAFDQAVNMRGWSERDRNLRLGAHE